MSQNLSPSTYKMGIIISTLPISGYESQRPYTWNYIAKGKYTIQVQGNVIWIFVGTLLGTYLSSFFSSFYFKNI